MQDVAELKRNFQACSRELAETRAALLLAERRVQEGEENSRLLEAVLNTIPEGLTLVHAARERVLTVSKYVADFAGLTRQDFGNVTLQQYVKNLRETKINGEIMSLKEIPLWRTIHGGETLVDEEYRLTNMNGKTIPVLINSVPVYDRSGKIMAGLVTWRNIESLKGAENQLRHSEYELRTILNNSPNIILQFDRFLRYVYVNSVFERITGMLTEQFAGKMNTELGMPKELEQVFDDTLRKVTETGRETLIEFNIASFFGRRYFQGRMIPVFEKTGLVETVILIAQDITELIQKEEQIRFVSFHDSVTNLYNRAYFEEEMRRLDNERELPVSIIMGDVNNLKLTNDTFGHKEGDKLLRRIADIMRISCRKTDIIARWGGDEFVVILPKTATMVADEICGKIQKDCRGMKDMVLQPSIALGAATKVNNEENIYRALRNAEEKMYENKAHEARDNEKRVISSIYEAVIKKQPVIDKHLERLKELIRGTASAFNIPRDDVQLLELVVELHEMGKISIPEDIWLKRGRLEPHEWEVMKKHSEVSYRISRTFADLVPVSDLLLALGEHWDGNGYPRGLKDEEIPCLARIFAILDAYDVMTHPQPYGSIRSAEEARDELTRMAGKQFDPGLVEIFTDQVVSKVVSRE